MGLLTGTLYPRELPADPAAFAGPARGTARPFGSRSSSWRASGLAGILLVIARKALRGV
jgi:hypothetical protein